MKPSKAKEVKKLDRIFSQYIRRKYADDLEHVVCCTCSKYVHWKECHAGHFVPRGCKNTRFLETNVHPQCCGCNTYRNGEQAKYLLFIEAKYGRPAVDELMELERQWKREGRWSVDVHGVREMQKEYKEKLKKLS